MKQIVDDIKVNCPECECSPEQTVSFLIKRGDISMTASNYREVWLFYTEALKIADGGVNIKKKAARKLTMEMMGVSRSKFRFIRTWAHKQGL